VLTDNGLFCFWLRFSSVTGLWKPAPSLKPSQKQKILAAHRYIISVNALNAKIDSGNPVESGACHRPVF
jgi:hypothetical protein